MFHRDHVARFVASLNFTPHDGAAIKERTEAAINEFGTNEDGHFSGGKLEQVLGSPELTKAFNDMWEKGQLHPPR